MGMDWRSWAWLAPWLRSGRAEARRDGRDLLARLDRLAWRNDALRTAAGRAWQSRGTFGADVLGDLHAVAIEDLRLRVAGELDALRQRLVSAREAKEVLAGLRSEAAEIAAELADREALRRREFLRPARPTRRGRPELRLVQAAPPAGSQTGPDDEEPEERTGRRIS